MLTIREHCSRKAAIGERSRLTGENVTVLTSDWLKPLESQIGWLQMLLHLTSSGERSLSHVSERSEHCPGLTSNRVFFFSRHRARFYSDSPGLPVEGISGVKLQYITGSTMPSDSLSVTDSWKRYTDAERSD